jgi:hypothetical protein
MFLALGSIDEFGWPNTNGENGKTVRHLIRFLHNTECKKVTMLDEGNQTY